jgi:hypothetical protein
MKFSACVNELVELWIEWLKNDRVCRDTTQAAVLRRRSSEKCERLIKRRYELISIMDSYFKENNDAD